MTRLVALALAAVGLSGCALRADQRLHFRAPADGVRADAAVLLSWTFDGAPPAGGYAVFVDRPPMRPGRDVDSLADSDAFCRRVTTCPDARWLADHGVYLTRLPELRLASLPVGRGRRVSAHLRRHDITVVTLDRGAVRDGEGAWTRTLYARDRRKGR